MRGLFGELDRACYLNVTAVVAVASAFSVPMVILTNIHTICYESSDLSRLDYQPLLGKGACAPSPKVLLGDG